MSGQPSRPQGTPNSATFGWGEHKTHGDHVADNPATVTTAMDTNATTVPPSVPAAKAGGRGSDRFLTLLLFLFGAAWIVACSTVQVSKAPSGGFGGGCPVPNPSLLPSPWLPVGDGTFINVDGDDDLECLVIYRYNVTGKDQGPLGGVVFDPQIGANGVKNLISYRLLPRTASTYAITDTLPGSLPGYLGTLGEKSADIRQYDTNGDGKPDELGIVGSDAADNKTTLSLYRWTNAADGYQLLGYFHGSYSVKIVDGPTYITTTQIYSGAVQTVQTRDLRYDRSGLVNMWQFTRNPPESPLAFSYRSNAVEFADGRPPQTCYYPEGQTLLYYQNLGRQVYDVRLFREDDQSGQATVCAGTWRWTPGQWRQDVTIVDLQRKGTKNSLGCDEWEVVTEHIQTNRIDCQP